MNLRYQHCRQIKLNQRAWLFFVAVAGLGGFLLGWWTHNLTDHSVTDVQPVRVTGQVSPPASKELLTGISSNSTPTQTDLSIPTKIAALEKLLRESSVGRRDLVWGKFWQEFTNQPPESALREFLQLEDALERSSASGLFTAYELYCIKRNLITRLRDDAIIKDLEQQMLQNRENSKSQRWLGLILGKRVMKLPPGSVLPLFDSLPNNQERATAEALYLGELRHRDVAAAADYFLKSGGAVPDKDTAGVIFSDWVRDDPESASKAIKSAAKSEKRDLAIGGMIQAIWKTDPDSARVWLTEIADPQLQKTIKAKYKL